MNFKVIIIISLDFPIIQNDPADSSTEITKHANLTQPMNTHLEDTRDG